MELCEEPVESEGPGAFPILARASSNQIGTEEPDYGGHEEDWADVEAAAEFNCPICLKVCRDAVMHSCRGIFCESCWNFCHASDDKCPMCRKTEHPAQQAYQQQWDIGKLLVKCPRNCGETFPLSEKQQRLPKHLEECSYEQPEAESQARVECPLCGIQLAASALDEHMESASREHMLALIREVGSLKAEVKGLQEKVRVLEAREG